jgi:hypothetical protein
VEALGGFLKRFLSKKVLTIARHLYFFWETLFITSFTVTGKPENELKSSRQRACYEGFPIPDR